MVSNLIKQHVDGGWRTVRGKWRLYDLVGIDRDFGRKSWMIN